MAFAALRQDLSRTSHSGCVSYLREREPAEHVPNPLCNVRRQPLRNQPRCSPFRDHAHPHAREARLRGDIRNLVEKAFRNAPSNEPNLAVIDSQQEELVDVTKEDERRREDQCSENDLNHFVIDPRWSLQGRCSVLDPLCACCQL